MPLSVWTLSRMSSIRTAGSLVARFSRLGILCTPIPAWPEGSGMLEQTTSIWNSRAPVFTNDQALQDTPEREALNTAFGHWRFILKFDKRPVAKTLNTFARPVGSRMNDGRYKEMWDGENDPDTLMNEETATGIWTRVVKRLRELHQTSISAMMNMCVRNGIPLGAPIIGLRKRKPDTVLEER